MISQLGRYEILGELGQGAMGVVYKARDPLIDRVVAIKTINLGLAMDEKEEYEGRFYQEAKAAGRLNHPNIVTIYDVGKSGDVAYIAMEFLEGRELRDVLKEGTLLPVEQVLNIVAQVGLGLAYAHEHDIIHRDVKPSNIMVIRDGHVKITDFGIARMGSSSVRTQTGMVLGSPKYMSPEQVMGKAIDRRSDIFSLGVMLYEMLTGQAPFDGENVNAIMYQTLNAITPPPSTINPRVPEMVNFIVAKALAKKVEDRYQSAKDLADDLRTCCDTMPRGGQQVDISRAPAGGEKKMSDTIEISGRMDAGEEEGRSASYAGLSKAFDSSVATMRLAALTATSEDVDELSKAFNMGRPSPETLIQTGRPAWVAEPVSPVQPLHGDISNLAEPPARLLRNLLMIILALLVLSGIILYFGA
ncbi:MAG TPA: serine/threonine-protein kinase [Gallionella sp.]|nr:serine/threonine-protein kinase [Gallionella sp.]